MQQTILATRYAENYKNRLHYQNYDHLPLSKKLKHHQRIRLVDDFPVFKECWLFQRDVDNFYLCTSWNGLFPVMN